MNTLQPLDGHSNEQASPKRRKSVYEKTTAHTKIFNPADVAILDNLGVDCFEHGGIPDALKCFQNAMSIFAPALPQSLCQEALKSFPSPCSDGMTRQVSVDPTNGSMIVLDNGSQDDSKVPRGAVARPLSPSASAPVAIAAPRTEYDEGMNSYSRPLRIDSNLHGNSHYDHQRTVPVLLLNIGQLHALGGDDVMAANYFMYALDIINQRTSSSPSRSIPSCPAVSPTTNNSMCPQAQPQQQQQPRQTSQEPIMDAMPILHNLGHIYYRAQNYKLAMSMYSKALDSAQNPKQPRGGSSNLSASVSTLNCLGVIFFHMSGNSDENASKALDMFTKSLDIRKSLLNNSATANCNSSSNSNDGNLNTDDARREIATTMNNVGRVYYMLGDHTAALTTYIEAYRLRKELLRANHLDLGASAYNLGQTHHQLGNLDDGKLYATRKLNV